MPPNPSDTNWDVFPSVEPPTEAHPGEILAEHFSAPPVPPLNQGITSFLAGSTWNPDPNASLDIPFYMIFNPEIPGAKRYGTHESAVLKAEELVKRYNKTFYIMRCVGRLEYIEPKLTDHGDDDAE